MSAALTCSYVRSAHIFNLDSLSFNLIKITITTHINIHEDDTEAINIIY